MSFCFGCEWLKREPREGTCNELLKWLGAEALPEATLWGSCSSQLLETLRPLACLMRGKGCQLTPCVITALCHFLGLCATHHMRQRLRAGEKSIIRPLESKIEDEEQDSLQRERNNSHFLGRKGKGIKLWPKRTCLFSFYS